MDPLNPVHRVNSAFREKAQSTGVGLWWTGLTGGLRSVDAEKSGDIFCRQDESIEETL
jgi:hypothetical protein